MIRPVAGAGPAGTGAPIVEAVDISKSFSGVPVLSDISFDVRPGEVHALLGENGAGKSTLLKILSGLVVPSSGHIRIAGADVQLSSPTDARTAGIATVYQETSLFPNLKVAENIFMGNAVRAAWGGLDWSAMRGRSRAILDSLDCRDVDVDMTVGSLSVAHKQQVEISRALALDAKVMIFDEPTTALNAADVGKLLGIIRQLRGDGVAIIYVSHRLEEIFALADRITVLRDGRLVGTRRTQDVDEAALVTMMVGRPLDKVFPALGAPGGGIRLEVRNLQLGHWLHDISFSVRSGEVLGIAGLVGAGRTTLAQSLFGVLPPTSGTVLVDGEAVSARSPQAAMARGLAYVPEDRARHGVVLAQTIRDNLTLPIMRRLARGPFRNRTAERAVARRGVRDFGVRARSTEQIVRQLSGGNQQKVVLAKWMATEPRVLILDEPTRGIDIGAKSAIYHLIAELIGRGLAVVLISSDLHEVLGMCHRILVMREGRVTAHFTREEADADRIGGAMTGIAGERGGA